MQMCVADSTQHAAQGERISNSDQLNQLMESVACGHVFMEPQQQVRHTSRRGYLKSSSVWVMFTDSAPSAVTYPCTPG